MISIRFFAGLFDLPGRRTAAIYWQRRRLTNPPPGRKFNMLDPGMVSVGPGTLLKGRYRVERLLGRGGMASVWRAEDQVLDRAVAVKVLSDTIASDPEFVARF